MLREQAKLIKQAHKVLDIGLTAGAFIAAYFIKRLLLPEAFRGLTTAPNYYVVLLMIIIVWYLTFEAFNVYASYRGRRLHRQLVFVARFQDTLPNGQGGAVGGR